MPDTLVAFAPERRSPPLTGGIAAVLEITFVIGLSFAAVAFSQALISPGVAQALGLSGGTPDLLAASWALLQQFAIQYGVLAILIFAIALWRRRRGARAYALGTGTLTAAQIVRYGILLGLIAGAPGTLLLMLQEYAPIGADTPMWAALRDAPRDLHYWVFMAVGSFALVPVVEEVAWRGYALGRLTETLAPGAAVVVAALPFALAHTQYSAADPAMALAVVSVLVLSFAGAFATLRTGSIWPAVIGHAIVNFPVDGWLGFAKLALIVLAILLFARQIGTEISLWASILFRRDSLQAVPPLLLLVAIAAALALAPGHALWIAAAVGLAAIAGIVRSRSTWAPEPRLAGEPLRHRQRQENPQQAERPASDHVARPVDSQHHPAEPDQ